MVQKIVSVAILLIFNILIFSIPQKASSQDDIQQLIKRINEKKSSINTYHVIMSTTIYPSCISMELLDNKSSAENQNVVNANSIVIGESGRKMNIKTTFGSDESDLNIKYNLIYDGIWLWIEQCTGKSFKKSNNGHNVSAMKIHIPDVSPNPKIEPFNTFFLITGIGLTSYEDLPGTFAEILDSYNFTKYSRLQNGNELIITGVHKKCSSVHMNKKSNEEGTKNDICEDEYFCNLKVLENSGLITAISYGNLKNLICMNTNIEYVSINNVLPKDIFNYQPPSGVTIRDITNHILEKKKEYNERLSINSK